MDGGWVVVGTHPPPPTTRKSQKLEMVGSGGKDFLAMIFRQNLSKNSSYLSEMSYFLINNLSFSDLSLKMTEKSGLSTLILSILGSKKFF